MRACDTSFALPSLFCAEDESCLNDSFSQSDDEYIQILIEKETTFEWNNSDKIKSSLKCARLDAIKWTLNNGKIWAIRLLAVACLSLAAKMEERNVPALSQYYVDEYNFERNMIQRMELLVLNTLDWKMGSITPFEFLHYFIHKFCDDSRPPAELVCRATELISFIMEEISLMDHRPSAIAAAVVLAATGDQLTRKLLSSR